MIAKQYNSYLFNTMESGLKQLSIATFNVHMWVDGDYEENYDRVIKLVKVSF